MKPERYISRNWRLICTSLALLLVLTINHRALPAYAFAPAAADKTAVQTSGRDAENSVIKQKVSLEAVASFTDLDLSHPAAWLIASTATPVQYLVQTAAVTPYWTFFLQRIATSPLSPNAP